MKKRAYISAMMLTAAVSFSMTGMAEETVTEEMTEAVSEAVIPETEKAEDFTITAGDVTVEVTNNAGVTIAEAAMEEAVEAESEAEAETEAAQAAALTLTDEEGNEYLFENVDLADMSEVTLTYADTFLFLNYKDAEGNSEVCYETAEEAAFDKEDTRYITNTVYIRQAPDKESEALAVAELGDEVTAIGALPKYVKVQSGDVTGYIARPYISASLADAESAMNAENAAIQAQQAAAAAAAAAAQAQAQASASAPSGKTEVGRQKVDDCDGSGHGYYIITYSDGSTSTQNY